MKIIRFLLTLLLIFGLFGCTDRKENSQNIKKEKILTIGFPSILSSLDPHKDWNGWQLMKLGVGETLLELDENYELKSKMLKSFRNLDPLTWELVLRDDVKFSNGVLLTPQKVVDSLMRTIELNPEAGALKGTIFEIDGDKILMKTLEPNGAALNSLADPHFMICDLQSGNLESKPILTGPYKVDKFSPKSQLEVVKNENYWNGSPKISRIVSKLVNVSATLGLALQSGEIDLAQVNSDTYQLLKNDARFTIKQIPSSRVYMFYVNPKKIPNKDVRKAIFAGINADEIANDLLKGGISVAYSPYPPNLPFALGADEVVKFDENLSHNLRADFSDEIVLKFYERLDLPKIATQIQAKLSKIGWNIKAVQGENYKYVLNGDYDLGMYSIVTLRIGDTFDYLNSVFGKNGVANFNGFEDDEVTQLLGELKTEFDKSKRNAISRQILQIAQGYQMHYFIGHITNNIAHKSGVSGVLWTPFEYKMICVDTDINE